MTREVPLTIAFDADSPGRCAFHCHNPWHQAAGMMTVVHYEGIPMPHLPPNVEGRLAGCQEGSGIWIDGEFRRDRRRLMRKAWNAALSRSTLKAFERFFAERKQPGVKPAEAPVATSGDANRPLQFSVCRDSAGKAAG
jgi:hypothetical protein